MIPYRIYIVPEVNGTKFSHSQKHPVGHNSEGRNKAEMEQPVFSPTSKVIQLCKKERAYATVLEGVCNRTHCTTSEKR